MQGAGVRKLVAAARKSLQALQQPASRLLHLAAQPRADQQQVKSVLQLTTVLQSIAKLYHNVDVLCTL